MQTKLTVDVDVLRKQSALVDEIYQDLVTLEPAIAMGLPPEMRTNIAKISGITNYIESLIEDMEENYDDANQI